VITQLLCATDWGELDYLIVDMPPGTGYGTTVIYKLLITSSYIPFCRDVQITLSQSAFFTGAVIVTTPHILSLADVTKAREH